MGLLDAPQGAPSIAPWGAAGKGPRRCPAVELPAARPSALNYFLSFRGVPSASPETQQLLAAARHFGAGSAGQRWGKGSVRRGGDAVIPARIWLGQW